MERFQSLDAIASDLAGLGNFNEAIKIRERTLAEYKKILEDNDAATIQMMTNLAENYVATKRYADAIKLCDETLVLQKFPLYNIDGQIISDFPSVMKLFEIKTRAQSLSGDDTTAYENYKNLIRVYEGKRFAITNFIFYLSSSEIKTRWFAQILSNS